MGECCEEVPLNLFVDSVLLWCFLNRRITTWLLFFLFFNIFSFVSSFVISLIETVVHCYSWLPFRLSGLNLCLFLCKLPWLFWGCFSHSKVGGCPSIYSKSHFFCSVYAINNLYASLGSPPLPGWVLNGGDPCVEGWQGVQCVNSNITGMYDDLYKF